MGFKLIFLNYISTCRENVNSLSLKKSDLGINQKLFLLT